MMNRAVYAYVIAAIVLAGIFAIPSLRAEAVTNYTLSVDGQTRKTFIVYLQNTEDNTNYQYNVGDIVAAHHQNNKANIFTSSSKPDLDIRYGLSAGGFFESSRDYISTYSRYESDAGNKTSPGPASDQITSLKFLGSEYQTAYLWIKSDSGVGLQKFDLRTEVNKYLYNNNAAKAVTLDQLANGSYLVTIKDAAGTAVGYVTFHPAAVVSMKAQGKIG